MPSSTFSDFALPVVPSIEDADFSAHIQHLLDDKTKPLGSLGRLEHLALRIACILGSTRPVLYAPQVVVFAADHGLAMHHGVSAFPVDVTWQMVANFLAGGAAVSVLARQHGMALHVVDCGVARDLAYLAPSQDTAPRLWLRKIALGTHDCTQGPAMTPAMCAAALRTGAELVQQLPGNVLLPGEMGIGNTSSAALLVSRLCEVDIATVTGAGTGLDAQGVQRKTAILQQVLQRHASVREPLDVLCAFGGLEIAAMTGAMLEAAQQRRIIVVDGFIATAALLVACRLRPAVVQRCVFAHQSAEGGHRYALQALGAAALPLLDWEMRLGEGSGAALVWPLLQSATTILRDMASFGSAGVDARKAC